MTKRKRIKGQAMFYKTQQQQNKIEQHTFALRTNLIIYTLIDERT
jgi:hypothetical protein